MHDYLVIPLIYLRLIKSIFIILVVLKRTRFLTLSAVRSTIAKKPRPLPWLNDDMTSVLCDYHMFLTIPKCRGRCLAFGRAKISKIRTEVLNPLTNHAQIVHPCTALRNHFPFHTLVEIAHDVSGLVPGGTPRGSFWIFFQHS